MNWYKISQSLGHNQDLNLLPDSFTSALPQSQETIEKLGVEQILSEFAAEKGYEEPLDYVLCSLFPEFEQECRAYYADRNKKLVDLHPTKYLEKLDNTLVAGILAFYRKRQQLLSGK